MSWTGLLTREIENTYKVTEGLLDLVDNDAIEWKPATGSNWMTTGQLLLHITSSCGGGMKGFVTGDWGMPDNFDISSLSPEEMLPPAEKMPGIGSLAEAKKLLADDKNVALAMLVQTSEDDLLHRPAPAPWDPREEILGHRLLEMVSHLRSHSHQLYYYLKLQGESVNTGNLWAM